MIQEQQRIWTASCIGDINTNLVKGKNNWIRDALILLKNEKISICNHEILDDNINHVIQGGNLEILNILSEKDILKSAESRKNKGILFFEQMIDHEKKNLMKWKHICVAQEKNIKGPVPKWYKTIKNETTIEGTYKLKKEYLIENLKDKDIHLKLFDEEEKINKNSVITWNDKEGNVIFGKDKKKSLSKKYKRIGYHYIIKNLEDEDNSPKLIKCEGCSKNISKNKNTPKETKECLIYIENDESRIIKERKEGEYLKPYETMKDIRFKNKMIKDYKKEDEIDKNYNDQIDLIDKTIGGDKNIIDIIKNSILEEEGETRYLIIECIKNKYKMNKQNGKLIKYSIIWTIRDRHNDGRTEIRIFAYIETKKEDLYTIILRSLILGYILLGKKTNILIGIDQNVLRLIENFDKEQSNRRKLDNDYYTELTFIKKLENDKSLKRDILSTTEENNIKKERNMMKDYLKKNEIEENNEIYFCEEGYKNNEYNLYWNLNLILGNYRGWQKKITETRWKNEFLNSKKIEDLFYYNFKDEFDWVKSLQFISNRNKNSIQQTDISDTRERAYKIKNLMKELPTYEVLNRRKVEGIEDEICPRCNDEIEDWEHIWICEKNEKNLNLILEESALIYRDDLRKNDPGKFEFFQEIEFNFLDMLNENSSILHNKTRKWELMRGVYNKKFNDLGKKKEEKEIIFDFWIFCYEQIKKEIWNKRCDEVAEMEKEKGLLKKDKRKRKKGKEEIDNEGNKDNKKQKNDIIKKEKKKEQKRLENRIKVVTGDTMINYVLDNKSIKDLWPIVTKIP
ncbi:hypothetical protein RhiirA1_453784 [Rhizophagus irregularis]|uniref:Uncharacterized protein n=1 Tax=Rhizophagus irregularis TaxID=588596 RepID=A0A2N0S6N3_9GLOM|nr:hypothetical protein RhiirA1_453784 [Rhizophagus irregularis]